MPATQILGVVKKHAPAVFAAWQPPCRVRVLRQQRHVRLVHPPEATGTQKGWACVQNGALSFCGRW